MASSGDQIIDILNQEFSKYTFRLVSEIKKEILSNFDKEEDVDRNPFEALKKSTERDRIRNKFPGKSPILKRTGTLRKSIEVTHNDELYFIDIFSTLPYGEDLSEGNHSGWWGKHAINADMPKRDFLGMPKEFQKGSAKRTKILSSFQEELLSKIHKIIDDIVGEQL